MVINGHEKYRFELERDKVRSGAWLAKVYKTSSGAGKAPPK